MKTIINKDSDQAWIGQKIMEATINLTDAEASQLMLRTDNTDLKSAILTAIQFTLDNY